MRNVYVAGVGMTPFGKFADRTVRDLAQDAVREALTDATFGITDVQQVFFANAVGGALHGQEMIRGQVALRDTGLSGLPIVNVENACASGTTAVHMAWLAVASGQVDVALAVGAEKLTHPDKRRTFDALATAIDTERADELAQELYEDGPLRGKPAGERSFFMDVYADMALKYMERTGATVRDLAAVAVKNHRHGKLNPLAQYRNEVTVEEVLASRAVSGPLTLLMCSPIGDGSAAVVLCSEEFARRSGAPLVEVAATAMVSGHFGGSDEAPERRASQRAYEIAGIGPQEVDVVELHDAAAPAELIILEELGICGPGESPKLLAAGDTTLGGRVPVNVSGGLLSKGHPLGATGCSQIVELTGQLRGRAGDRQVEGARIALAENGGGYLGTDPAVACATILRRRR